MTPTTTETAADTSISDSTIDSSADGGLLHQPPFWYAFETGGVHWTMLSSEHDYTNSSAQRKFAEVALVGDTFISANLAWA
jgi:hypothetical protein